MKVGTLNILVCCLVCLGTFIQADVIDPDAHVTFGQKLSEKPTKEFNVSEHRLVYTDLADGRPYAVYDGILSSKTQVLIKQYLTHSIDGWLFNNYDQDDENKQKTYDNCPWINEKDPLEFSLSNLNKRLLAAVRDVAKNDEEYFPYRVFGKIIRRGDHTLVAADSNSTGDFTAFVFVNEFWRKNYYGELYLYDKDREIVGGSTHRPGRVVIYESSTLRLNRPPAVAFLQGQVLFQVQYSTSKGKMEAGHQTYTTYLKNRAEAYKNAFYPGFKLPSGEPFEPVDPAKHKVMEYTTKKDGRKIFVYDNLFPKELLDHLRDYTLRYGSYFYDDSIDKHSDNVQWIAGFLLDPYISSPYWKVVSSVAKHATGSDKMFPYDVSINLVRNSDHTRIHGDVGYYGEEEFTVLVYLNPNWKKNYYGETTFFERNADDTEIVCQVRPRYGRTVIFDGNIPHSARPPSFNFTGARLTFVTKLHKNEYTGRKKNFQEEHRHLAASVGGIQSIKQFAGKKGEKFAKRQLDELRKQKEKITYRPDAEKGEEDEEEGQGEQGAGAGNDIGVGLHEKPEGETPFFEEEPDNPFSEKLSRMLNGVKEASSDGIVKISAAHEKMQSMKKITSKKLADNLIKVM